MPTTLNVGALDLLHPGTVRADPHTTEMARRQMEAYVASGEWRDKAGGYAIQENADAFVTSLEGGGFDNVVGLPVALSLRLLARLGAPGLPNKAP